MSKDEDEVMHKVMNAVLNYDNRLCVCSTLNINNADYGFFISSLGHELGLGNISLSRLKMIVMLYHLILKMLHRDSG